MRIAKLLAPLALAAALWLAPAAPADAAPCDFRPNGARCVFDFESGFQGFRGGFADLPADRAQQAAFDLRFGRVPLPASTGRSGNILALAGTNRSADLLLYVGRRIEGLLPSTSYAVRYRLDVVTNAGAGCVGAGGPPGESVFVKAGASAVRPVPRNVGGTLRLPLDIGNQFQGGRDARVIGNIAAPGPGCSGSRFAVVRRDGTDEPVFALTDAQGRLFLFVGFDSGFEGRTEVGLDRVEVRIDRVRR